jgi:hypothetical protein
MGINKAMLAVWACLVMASASLIDARDVLPLDNWRLSQSDLAGAEQPAFNDSQWQSVHVPNDWSIAGPFAETNSSGGAGAFLPGGVAWYRTHFALPSYAWDRRVFVEFDGIMGDCDLWINGMHLGHRTNNFAAFRYELPAAMLGFGNGTNNILTVCTDTSVQPACDWYVGAGILRRARVLVLDPVHITADGASLHTLNISAAEATMQIETTLTNESAELHDVSLQTTLVSADGEMVGAMESSETVVPGTTTTLEQPISFPNPHLWTGDVPALYRAVRKLHVDGQLSDEQATTFAVRDVHFDAGTGAKLNRKPFKLRAVALYPDGGAFGAAVPFSILESRLRTLRALGVNAICPEANAFTPELTGLCDRLGLLVMEPSSEVSAMSGNPCALGMDYLGGSPGWPAIGHGSGLLDRTGAVTPLGREREAGWRNASLITVARRVSPTGNLQSTNESGSTLLSDWTPEDLKPHTENVEVYCNCRQVELFLNGRSLGRKAINSEVTPRNWLVSFAPGVLKAVGSDGHGRSSITNEFRTAGKPVKIVLTADRKSVSPAWDDVAIVRAAVVDAKGVTVARAGDLINFRISGPGVIAAVDNADNASHEPFQSAARHAFRGLCAAFVRAEDLSGKILFTAPSGKFTLTATAAGLKPASITFKTSPGPAE